MVELDSDLDQRTGEHDLVRRLETKLADAGICSPAPPPMSNATPFQQPRVVVVIPTFNERENLAELTSTVADHGYDVLIVDDSSPDGTGAEADRLAKMDSRISVCHRAERQGLGPAYAQGFSWALESGYDVICGMDGDLSHDPADIPRLVAPIARDGADLVIGSRYIEGGAIPNWSIFRRFLSAWGNIYARRALRMRVKDATSGYRAYRAEALRRLNVSTCKAVGYLFLTEVTWRATASGLRIVEVPIVFRRRSHGESKMGGRIILEAMALVTFWGVRARLPGQGVKPEATRNIDLDRTGGPDP